MAIKIIFDILYIVVYGLTMTLILKQLHFS